jgi:hypothetical protein
LKGDTKGGDAMARRNWDKIAQKEYEALDKEWQEDWADLIKKVQNR